MAEAPDRPDRADTAEEGMGGKDDGDAWEEDREWTGKGGASELACEKEDEMRDETDANDMEGL